MTVFAARAVDLSQFYAAFAPICFTLLGLWLIVVQTRHSEWRHSNRHRSRAYTISLLFALPGMMALLSLVVPRSQSLWRASFASVAILGAAILLGLRLVGPYRDEHSPIAELTLWLAVALYALIAFVALAPRATGGTWLGLAPIEFEAILLSILVFVAANTAWFLMFDEAPGELRGDS